MLVSLLSPRVLIINSSRCFRVAQLTAQLTTNIRIRKYRQIARYMRRYECIHTNFFNLLATGCQSTTALPRCHLPLPLLSVRNFIHCFMHIVNRNQNNKNIVCCRRKQLHCDCCLPTARPKLSLFALGALVVQTNAFIGNKTQNIHSKIGHSYVHMYV